MNTISSSTLTMAIQGVHAEIVRILANAGGDVGGLAPDDQELLMAFDKAENELKALYLLAAREQPGLPSYESLVQDPAQPPAPPGLEP